MNHHRFLVNIRPIKPEEITLLSDFLYEAIYQPAGRPLLPRTTIQHPSLWCYIESFGSRKGDACLVAESDALVVGAIWVRYMHGCGYVDDDTPESLQQRILCEEHKLLPYVVKMLCLGRVVKEGRKVTIK